MIAQLTGRLEAALEVAEDGDDCTGYALQRLQCITSMLQQLLAVGSHWCLAQQCLLYVNLSCFACSPGRGPPQRPAVDSRRLRCRGGTSWWTGHICCRLWGR